MNLAISEPASRIDERTVQGISEAAEYCAKPIKARLRYNGGYAADAGVPSCLVLDASALDVGLNAQDQMRVPHALPVVANLAAAKATLWAESAKRSGVVKISQLIAELAPRIATVRADVETAPGRIPRRILFFRLLWCPAASVSFLKALLKPFLIGLDAIC